ncbi:putative dihydrolipoyllysine-residue acetyltransferase [Helianthus annuus]|nr:putative dihydrolipoyllysine-residue acetyltransferase [Helianthus annuus]KAJ0602413.1 putative dihydrolipoyllysine-residue acetyltransferase [Helianthus annuus]KAJ0802571.1 putative dihydrolipoyllysine-residue acetyltransferase [Helianthus annuus]
MWVVVITVLFVIIFNLGVMRKTSRSILGFTGKLINDVLSFVVFSVLDVLDVLLCYVYKIVDFVVENEWKPCYCSFPKEAIINSGNILVSENGEAEKIVCLTSTKLHLEEISDTLYSRPSRVKEVSKTTVKRTSYVVSSVGKPLGQSPVVVKMPRDKIDGHKAHAVPRWSDCDCDTCNSWSSSCKDTLFVRMDGRKDNVSENVLFIHGFISSSEFWTETLFPNFSRSIKSKYRLFAIDLLGFGKSPKPNESLYTMKEHLDMIERSVLEPNKVESFHIVAHSLGCILALALAVKYPKSVKSLTLLAPPYFPTPKGEEATQYMMRKVAPRQVWPLIAFGASMACWYEHVSRTICLLICKHHRTWKFLTKLITRNRIRTYLIEGFCCHTHNAAWHTLHNVICGSASKIEEYLDMVQNRLNCSVNVFHGRDDELIPVECSDNVKTKVPRAHVRVVEKKDHITIVVGRQKAFARELEQIWKNSKTN